MALRDTPTSADPDLFRQELVNLINLRHPLVQLAQKIDWTACEAHFGGLYAAGIGRPGHPIGLMVGLQLLKHTSNLSDEEVVAVWVENPYWQHFCGEPYFRHDTPIDGATQARSSSRSAGTSIADITVGTVPVSSQSNTRGSSAQNSSNGGICGS